MADAQPATTDAYFYSCRFEPAPGRRGFPTRTMVAGFLSEMYDRVSGLHAYLDLAAWQRSISSPQCESSKKRLIIETGKLWPHEYRQMYSQDTTGDLSHLAGAPKLEEVLWNESTYTLLRFADVVKIVARKKTYYLPEAELYVMSDSEEFCHDVGGIMEFGLPETVRPMKIRRLGVDLSENGISVGIENSPMIKGALMSPIANG